VVQLRTLSKERIYLTNERALCSTIIAGTKTASARSVQADRYRELLVRSVCVAANSCCIVGAQYLANEVFEQDNAVDGGLSGDEGNGVKAQDLGTMNLNMDIKIYSGYN
jgi:hypothetical protein